MSNMKIPNPLVQSLLLARAQGMEGAETLQLVLNPRYSGLWAKLKALGPPPPVPFPHAVWAECVGMSMPCDHTLAISSLGPEYREGGMTAAAGGPSPLWRASYCWACFVLCFYNPPHEGEGSFFSRCFSTQLSVLRNYRPTYVWHLHVSFSWLLRARLGTFPFFLCTKVTFWLSKCVC